jgi:hypothetical protein
MYAVLLLVGQTALPMAHAHNDYEHRRPLLDALSHGFRSVEADVYLVNGRLLVAHDRKDLMPSRTLKSLYLEPLAMLAREGLRQFTLMVDVKTDGTLATRALIEELSPYRWMISGATQKAVKVVVSGVGDRQVIERESFRLLSIDGRPADLELPRNRDIAWVSDNWNNHFKWKGSGPFEDRPKLLQMVTKAHERGYRLRFWATPEQPAVWRELLEAQVDLIGTDRLGDLAKFLRDQTPSSPKTMSHSALVTGMTLSR